MGGKWGGAGGGGRGGEGRRKGGERRGKGRGWRRKGEGGWKGKVEVKVEGVEDKGGEEGMPL